MKEIRIGRYVLKETWEGQAWIEDTETGEDVTLPPHRVRELEQVLEAFVRAKSMSQVSNH